MILSFIVGVLTGAIQAGTSVLYAALGETINERAGIINLGLEGAMLIGASVGFAVTYQTGTPLAGIAAAAFAALQEITQAREQLRRRQRAPAHRTVTASLHHAFSARQAPYHHTEKAEYACAQCEP